MTKTSTIQESLAPLLSGLRYNTSIIDNSAILDFTKIENGVLIVYAAWSGQAIINCAETIRTLYKENFAGQIILIDTDCMTPDFQMSVLGHVCHGWGEIFIIHNGKIGKRYLGKDSFVNYKIDTDNEEKI